MVEKESGVDGIEPPTKTLEIPILPLYYTPCVLTELIGN
jgi:hypothetical protein